MKKNIHRDFKKHLILKDKQLQSIYKELRNLIIDLYPDGNEILYHTHALTSVYSTSLKLSDAYCHIPIYTQHLNLGFNYGVLLDDPHNLLCGTGKLIRHIPVTQIEELKSTELKTLIADAVAYSLTNQKNPSHDKRRTVSKIKN